MLKIKIIHHKQDGFSDKLAKIINQNNQSQAKQEKIVSKIISQVKKNGDQEIINLCNQFDKTNFQNPNDFLVKKSEINAAKNNLDQEVIKALELSFKRVSLYHQKQLPQDFFFQDDLGNNLGNIWKNIEKVAIYVPGGTATYPSSVIMNAAPAIVAGCQNITMTTPSNGGKINDTVLMAAEICGIKNIYKIGGAAAIAGLAFGTKTIDKVDKIVGPGNNFVALAKKQLFGQVGIDMIAGPTDILIIADKQTITADWVAADLLSQAEHGIDSRVILITNNLDFASLVNQKISKLAENLSRLDIIKQSIKKSAIIVIENLIAEAAKIANQFAPEHLEIITQNQDEIFKQIKNAGAVFLGKYSPEAIGDYLAGPSHTLPTSKTAKFSSGLSIFDFLKRMSVINCCKTGFLNLQKPAALMAESEGLLAHQLSILIRK